MPKYKITNRKKYHLISFLSNEKFKNELVTIQKNTYIRSLKISKKVTGNL